MNIKDKIYNYIDDSSIKLSSIEELEKIFEIPKDQKREFRRLVQEMEDEGYVYKTRKGKIGSARRLGFIIGRLQGNQRGFAFLIPESPEEQDIGDVFISHENLNGAYHGDKVAVKIIEDGRESNYENRRRNGEVIKILQRANSKLIGLYQRSEKFGFVVPLDNRMSSDIFILNENRNKAEDGQVVEVEILNWNGDDDKQNPEGKIVEVLGYQDEKGVDIKAIMKKYGLVQKFPEEVIAETKKIPDDIREEEIKRRKDLRDVNLFTIDGADAKDFDDAVSIKILENGNYELGVHIADVSHYVREFTALDKEALERGTSVYFVDRVIPMLPEKLSNGVCSLNPNEDRLAMTTFMEIDKKGKVISHQIYESIVNSKARLIYRDVSDFLEDKSDEVKERFEDMNIASDLKEMEKLSNILHKKRRTRGSIDFDFPESYIEIDDDGKPIAIKEAERRVGNRMIEEFMLVTNETIAEYIYWIDIPFLYRIHEEPDDEKILGFKKFLNTFGYKLRDGGEGVEPKDLQKLLENIKGKKEEPVISKLMLRSLKKAKYSTEELGHFGLAADYYSHFTSPIRRYPDLQIHRILKQFINHKLDNDEISKYRKNLPQIAEMTSLAERKADEAEREVEDLKKVEFMEDKIGEEFEGVISGIISSGFFVELPNTVEGFVPIHSIDSDYYHVNEEMHCLVGEMTKNRLSIGDKVMVKLVSATPANRKIDFSLISQLD
ncbi:MAG: ribonuclease R [Andreesenia angusta]|nr:ribonuclease R [Andreesenia angusta]